VGADLRRSTRHPGWAGFIPGVGIFADLANAGIYAVEGNLGMAALSAVAAATGIGDGIKAGAMAAKAGKQVAGEVIERATKESPRKLQKEGPKRLRKGPPRKSPKKPRKREPRKPPRRSARTAFGSPTNA